MSPSTREAASETPAGFGHAASPQPAGSTPDVPARPDRIESIDVLRGFALLGILVMNVQTFSMIGAAYFNPTAYGDLTGLNRAVWVLCHVLADQKMMSIFGMLFGAGIVLMTEGRIRAGRRPAATHYRRMAALLVIGLAHAYGLWAGDILVTYALCGMIAYPFRRLRPALLLPLGVASIAVSSGLFLLAGWSVPYWPEDAVAAVEADMAPPPEAVADELAAYRGGWLQQSEYRVEESLYFQTFAFAVWGLWRALGLMLIGMALFKWGVFSASRTRRFYAILTAVGVAVGVPVVAYGVAHNFARGWGTAHAFFVGSQFNYWGSLPVALGWVGTTMLLCQAGDRAARATRPLAAVGRLALTNYLLQTVICTTIFYGHGFGLFGRVERVGQLGIVIAIWAVQLIGSTLYLRRFRIGPAEWLWRCATDLRVPPLRQERPGVAVGSA